MNQTFPPRPVPEFFPTARNLAIFLEQISDILRHLEGQHTDAELKRVARKLLSEIVECLPSGDDID